MSPHKNVILSKRSWHPKHYSAQSRKSPSADHPVWDSSISSINPLFDNFQKNRLHSPLNGIQMFDSKVCMNPWHPGNLTSVNTKILNITLPNFIKGDEKIWRSLTNDQVVRTQKSSKLMNQNFWNDKVGRFISMKNGYQMNLNIAYSLTPIVWNLRNAHNFHP